MLCPLTPSTTHVALATVRMEPQFMIIGHTAGVAAALAVEASSSVHDIDLGKLRALLLADKQILSLNQVPHSLLSSEEK